MPGEPLWFVVLAFSIVNSGLNSLDSETRWVENWMEGHRFGYGTNHRGLGDNPGRISFEDATVMNYLEWVRVPLTYDMRPEIWSEAISGNGRANDYRAYVDSLEGGYGGP